MRIAIATAALLLSGGAALSAPVAVDSTDSAKSCTAAQTSGGMTTVYTTDKDTKNDTGGKIAVAHCVNTWQTSQSGYAVTSTFKTSPAWVDPADHSKGVLSIDGHDIIDGSFNHVSNPVAEVHGTNGIAIGNGAMVGGWTPPSKCTNGGALDGLVCKGTFTPGVAKDVANGTAIGANASVQHDDSTAIGANAKTTNTHQIVLGTQAETITAPGITSQTSKDRQSGPTEIVTSDGSGNLATDGGTTFSRITALETWSGGVDATLANHGAHLGILDAKVAANSADIANLKGDVTALYKLNAIAMAMPNLYLGDRERISFALGGGFNENAAAFSAGGMFRINGNWAGYGAVSTDGEHVGGKVGVRTGW